MKNILLLDPNDTASRVIASKLTDSLGFSFFGEDSVDAAAKRARSTRIDTLITGVDLPRWPNFILHIKKQYPDMQIIVVAKSFPNSLIEQLKSIGITHFLTKPLQEETLSGLIAQRRAPAPQTNISVPQSNIYGVALSSFLQMLNLEKKTGTLAIRAGNQQGNIFIMDGEIIAARTRNENGLPAFYQIMAWHEPDIKLSMERPAVPRDINKSLMHLLMEAHQQNDEAGNSQFQAARAGQAESTVVPDINALMTDSPVARPLADMQAALYKVVGPIAKILFQNAVRKWAGSTQPTRAALSQLAEIIAQEINNPDKEQAYLNMITPNKSDT